MTAGGVRAVVAVCVVEGAVVMDPGCDNAVGPAVVVLIVVNSSVLFAVVAVAVMLVLVLIILL